MKINSILLLIAVVGLVWAGLWYYDSAPQGRVGIDDLITIDSPRPQQVIHSPVVIRGTARGPWYFEASFPIVLTDGDGRIIAEGHGQAQGEWMTEAFVPFEAVLTFNVPENAAAFGNRGTIILKKDNPSGEPSRDQAVEIPILFN
jgi:hypothetical protein